MGNKVKELKDNAVVEVKINKVFYMMLKQTLLYIFKQEQDQEKISELIKKVTDKNSDNEPHSEQEFAFKTILLLLAEIVVRFAMRIPHAPPVLEDMFSIKYPYPLPFSVVETFF